MQTYKSCRVGNRAPVTLHKKENYIKWWTCKLLHNYHFWPLWSALQVKRMDHVTWAVFDLIYIQCPTISSSWLSASTRFRAPVSVASRSAFSCTRYLWMLYIHALIMRTQISYRSIHSHPRHPEAAWGCSSLLISQQQEEVHTTKGTADITVINSQKSTGYNRHAPA